MFTKPKIMQDIPKGATPEDCFDIPDKTAKCQVNSSCQVPFNTPSLIIEEKDF